MRQLSPVSEYKGLLMFKRQLLAAVMFGAAIVTTSMAPDAWAQSKKGKALQTEAADVPLA